VPTTCCNKAWEKKQLRQLEEKWEKTVKGEGGGKDGGFRTKGVGGGSGQRKENHYLFMVPTEPIRGNR